MRLAAIALVTAALGGLGADGRAEPVEGAVEASARGNQAAAAAQGRIDKLSDDTDALAAEYRAALQETRALESYNKQLESLIAAQGREMKDLRLQIDRVTVVGRQVMPLMLRMLDALEQFVELDLPFLLEERRERVAGLRRMMDRADVTISEKYRRLLEAFQIENEYGRTIEAYRGPLEADGQSRTVDFLRVGRNVLLYQTLDGNESGIWQPDSASWAVLSGSYRIPIRQGLRIARKQAAPDLIRIPMPAAPAVAR
jgi:hypothetical protein